VPLLSGHLQNGDFDDINDATAKAGITCAVCHSIAQINSNTGNADYTIQEPVNYPLALSDSPILQSISDQLIRMKSQLHKHTYLKPFHSSTLFCSCCHKASLPMSVNHYKEFLRGQNHYDSYRNSDVAGHNSMMSRSQLKVASSS
jgi:hypothetical protein